MLKCILVHSEYNIPEHFSDSQHIFQLTTFVSASDIILRQYCTITIVSGRTISASSFSSFGSCATYISDAAFPGSPSRKTLRKHRHPDMQATIKSIFRRDSYILFRCKLNFQSNQLQLHANICHQYMFVFW